jgi:hypothetical protein
MSHSITVQEIFSELEAVGNNPVDRIALLSAVFLGKPYLADPQGEGANAAFDCAPLYRFDGFDCVTFVNNILALSLSSDLFSFEKKLLQINYYHGEPRYENRFHFMSADWNPQNQKNHIVSDVTETIVDEKNNPIANYAEGEIDRSNWLLKKAEKETGIRAAFLQQMASQAKKEWVSLPYLPLSALFDEHLNPIAFIFDQIPHAAVVEIVRPNWNLKEKIGTNLHVSHLGFAIRKSSGELVFRHASSEQQCVVEVLLSDYLKNHLNSETIKGVNIQRVICV